MSRAKSKSDKKACKNGCESKEEHQAKVDVWRDEFKSAKDAYAYYSFFGAVATAVTALATTLFTSGRLNEENKPRALNNFTDDMAIKTMITSSIIAAAYGALATVARRKVQEKDMQIKENREDLRAKKVAEFQEEKEDRRNAKFAETLAHQLDRAIDHKVATHAATAGEAGNWQQRLDAEKKQQASSVQV